jgi:hypothetical protein
VTADIDLANLSCGIADLSQVNTAGSDLAPALGEGRSGAGFAVSSGDQRPPTPIRPAR